MGRIQLKYNGETHTITPYEGRNIDTAVGTAENPGILLDWKAEKGHGVSQAAIRLMGLENSAIRDAYWDSVNFLVHRGDDVMYVLSRTDGQLSDAVEYSLRLIGGTNPSELVDGYGVPLNVDDSNGNNRWERYEQWGSKDGVIATKRSELFTNGVGLNSDFKNPQEAKDCLAVRIAFGHPDEVDADYAITKEKFNEIIDGTFKLRNNKASLGQWLPAKNDDGVLSAWVVNRLDGRVGSIARSWLDNGSGRFALDSVGDDLEGRLKSR